MIRWSPSIDNSFRKLSLRSSKLNLFPPFFHRKEKIHVSETDDVEAPKKPRIALGSTEEQVISLKDDVTTCKTYISDDGVQKKSVGTDYILCKDDCRRKTVTCQDTLHRMDMERSFTDIAEDELHVAFEHPGEDYRQEEEETELGEKFESETDRIEEKDESRSWLLSQCESFSSLSDCEEEPNTIDPFLSHQLYLPYNKIQRPRYLKSTVLCEETKPIRLPRRPRSPIRQILPGKFDLELAYQQWDRKRRVTEKRKYLEESKQRISQSITRMSGEGLDEHTLISSVVLQAVCEQVTLALTDVKIDINIQTFVNIAVIWALSDMEIFDYDLYFDRNVPSEDTSLFNWKQQDIIDVMGTGGMRKILLGVYRVPLGCNIITSLHRRLPWHYVSPSHERGHTKFYPHVRERIDEKIAGHDEEDHTMTHVPDLNCFHLKEVLDKSYVAYRRKSKSFVVRMFSNKEKRDLFMQLLSLM